MQIRKEILSGCWIVLIIFCLGLSNAMAWPVPDTGQTICYDDLGNIIPCPSPGQPFYGQDANYTIHEPSYTKLDSSGNPLPDNATQWVMVRDNITHLIWEIKTDDGSIHDKDMTSNWLHANDITFIPTLNKTHFGGYTDWRLPTIIELSSLVNAGGEYINTNFFLNLANDIYWSSSTGANDTNRAWGLWYEKDWLSPKIGRPHHMRAVRGGQSQANYVDNGDGTLTDTNTGLVWQQGTAPQRNWKEALLYCENLSFAGHSDWRLPNLNELKSLVDYTLTGNGPCIDTTFFPNSEAYVYWSSTSIAAEPTCGFAVAFYHPGPTPGPAMLYWKGYTCYVRAVRGGQSDFSGDVDGDGYTESQGDCNDNDAAIHPGATEICGDGKDNNCDGTIDEGCVQNETWYKDVDGDNYSDGTSLKSINRPNGNYYLASELTATSGDCDDNDNSINPEATEICGDGKDNNCDGTIDEGCNLNLSPPSSLAAQAKASTQITVSWKDNSTDETGFKIFKKSGDCNSSNQWGEIATKDANSTSQTVSGLSPNTTYSFSALAYNASGNSTYSDCASATTAVSGTPPAPTNLKAESVSSSQVNLTWNDTSTNEKGFKIFRKAGAGAWELLKTTGPNVKSFSDTTATTNTTSTSYRYYIYSYNDSGQSPQTYPVIVPYQPESLTATSLAAKGKIKLTWTDTSNDENGFEIWRKSGSCSSGGAWTLVTKVAANRTSWVNSGLTSGNTYSYRVRAYKRIGSMLSTIGYSLWSNCSSANAP